MYRNFIFDLYGTLVDVETDETSLDTWAAYCDWLSGENIIYDAAELKAKFDGITAGFKDIVTPYEYPEHDLFPVFAKVLRERRADYTDGQVYAAGAMFRRISTKKLRLFPNTMKVLTGLRDAGRKVYLLSNAQRMFTWQELEMLGLIDCFDDIFISSDEGCMKPDKAFIGRLIDRHGLKVGESIMVGNDCRSDVAVADAVGMDAAYVRTSPLPGNGPDIACRYVYNDGDIGHILELIK